MPLLSSIIRSLMFICLLTSAASALASLNLTPEEARWVKEHRSVRYTFMAAWPLEYVGDGKHQGLSRAYLDEIGRVTGLRFVPGRPGEDVQLYTNLVPALMPEAERNKWLLSQRWLTSNTLIVTRHNAVNSRTLALLSGKRVAVIAGSWHESWLRRNYPRILLTAVKDASALFEHVYREEVDAGVGPDLVLRPLLYRTYSHLLVVAGQVPSMVASMHMGVSADNLPLLNIINKALSAMPASKTDAMFSRWAGQLQLGSPTIGMIFSLYAVEIGLFIALIIALTGLLYWTMLVKKRAVASEQRTNQFLAMMSHEIRTPMNALIAALELLRLPGTPERHEEYVELACYSSDNLLILLNNILDHSKLSQNHVRLEKDCFSLSATFSALVAVCQPMAIKKGLTIELTDSLDADGGWIVSDEYRLRQVVANLISNAIKFTERGGVRISLYWMSGENAGDLLCIDVADSGIGIAKEDQHNLFAAWMQVDRDTTRRYDGSGLGLYISHQLIKLAGGTLQCYSQPGTGTTFRVQLPVERCEAPTVRPDPVTLPRYAEGTSILVVEDHPANQKMLGAQLEQLGCHFDIAPDGMTAVRMLREENYYDVMLLDCNLPDIDGYEVARKVRALEDERGLSSMPIVAVSAMNGVMHQKQCDESGMNAQLTKPVSLRDLSQILSEWCEIAGEIGAGKVSLRSLSADEYRTLLLQDIAGFSQALNGKNSRMMIYYAHRIKGAAQLYDLVKLASMAEKMEAQLRSGTLPLREEGIRWAEDVRAELRSAARF